MADEKKPRRPSVFDKVVGNALSPSGQLTEEQLDAKLPTSKATALETTGGYEPGISGLLKRINPMRPVMELAGKLVGNEESYGGVARNVKLPATSINRNKKVATTARALPIGSAAIDEARLADVLKASEGVDVRAASGKLPDTGYAWGVKKAAPPISPAPKKAVYDDLIETTVEDLRKRGVLGQTIDEIRKRAQATTVTPPAPAPVKVNTNMPAEVTMPATTTTATVARPKFDVPYNKAALPTTMAGQEGPAVVSRGQGLSPEVLGKLRDLGFTGDDYFRAVAAINEGGWNPLAYEGVQDRAAMLYDMATASPDYTERKAYEDFLSSPYEKEMALDLQRATRPQYVENKLGRRTSEINEVPRNAGAVVDFQKAQADRWNTSRDRRQADLIEKGRQAGRISDREYELRTAMYKGAIDQRGQNIGLLNDRETRANAMAMLEASNAAKLREIAATGDLEAIQKELDRQQSQREALMEWNWPERKATAAAGASANSGANGADRIDVQSAIALLTDARERWKDAKENWTDTKVKFEDSEEGRSLRQALDAASDRLSTLGGVGTATSTGEPTVRLERPNVQVGKEVGIWREFSSGPPKFSTDGGKTWRTVNVKG